MTQPETRDAPTRGRPRPAGTAFRAPRSGARYADGDIGRSGQALPAETAADAAAIGIPAEAPAPNMPSETHEQRSAGQPRKAAKPDRTAFSRARLVVALALVLLVTKLAVSGFNYVKGWQPQAPSFPKAGDAAASTLPAAGSAAMAQAGGLSSAAGSMLSGAAMLFGEAADPALAVAAQAIPLPPGDDSLLKPQRPAAPPPALAPVQAQGPVPVQAQAPGQAPAATAPPPVPASPGGATSNELARREFEINRREQQLNVREEALRQMETDVNVRIREAEDRESSIKEMLARNDAILAEQKAVREDQQKADDALKSERVEHLVAAFKGMKPEQAGNLFNSMDDSVAVAILTAMPGSNAGKILAMVSPDKAARLVKAISEQRVDPRVLLESSQLPEI
ncbi:MAG: hypothetical protein LBR80_13935 [Deltaproteobacteria bacterium]|nr:hypothetical protein [Deltaproteobacteria bacterium]